MSYATKTKKPKVKAEKKAPARTGKSPGASDDTLSELVAYAQRDQARWEKRNQRFQKDQELYSLQKPGESSSWSKKDTDIIILNDPRVLIKKVSRILARHPNVIENAPSSPALTTTAQRMENFCYSWDQSIATRWVGGLHNPYRYDQSFFVTLRGWLSERTVIMPDGVDDMESDPAAIYDHQIFDPAQVYPATSGNNIVRVSHVYQATAAELLDDPVLETADPAAIKVLEEAAPTAVQKVQAFYWKAADGGWYHAILIGSEWFKKPIELGYNPWTIVLANGAAYRATSWDEEAYLDQIGTGLLDESSENQKYLNRAITKLNSLLSLEANPPVTVFTPDGRPIKVNFEPGSRMFMTSKDKMDIHRIGPQLGDYKLLWDILTQRAERAGLPAAFFAEYTGESSMAHAVLMSAGRDVLYPFTEALNMLDTLKYKKVLELYRDFGPSRPLRAKMLPDSLGISETADITAADIQAQGTTVEVSRTDMTPQELIQRVNLAMALADKKLLSFRTVRGRDWIGVRNPDKENLQVLAESVYMDQDVVKRLVPAALSETGQQMLLNIWQTIQSGMPQPGSPADQNPAAAGLPSQVLPPGMQTGDPLTNQNNSPDQGAANALMSLLNGGASGGGGAGGIPPQGPLPTSFPSPLAQFGIR